MKFTSLILIIDACLVCSAATAVELGDTREQVVAELGEPDGEANAKGTRQLFYSGGIVELKGGKVSHVDPNFEKRASQRAANAAFEAEQHAKGLVLYDGNWMPAEAAQNLEIQKKARAAYEAERARSRPSGQQAPAQVVELGNKVRDVRENGSPTDIATLLKPGQITIVDFYADWCGPCQRLSPSLVNLAARNTDVYLCKIDIVAFDSPLAKQYRLESIPHVRVFDRAGRMVGGPTSDITKIDSYVQQALR